MLKLTQEILGSEDEDLRRDARAAGDPAAQLSQFMDVVADFETYFAELTEARRKDPRDDVASIIAHAKIDGAVMGHTEAMSYYVIIATAGHDTTSSSTSGAIWALCEHPGEFRKSRPIARSFPNWSKRRCATPRRSAFHALGNGRYADSWADDRRGRPPDAVLPFRQSRRGSLPGPDLFRVDRDATRHVAFGYGSHVCLGQHLVRLEMRIFFRGVAGKT